MKALTDDQVKILRYMASEPGEGPVRAWWVAEGCGHFYAPEWASRKLPGLVKRGLVERLTPGWYNLTVAGRAAAATPSSGPAGN